MSVKIKTLQVIYEDGRQATYPRRYRCRGRLRRLPGNEHE